MCNHQPFTREKDDAHTKHVNVVYIDHMTNMTISEHIYHMISNEHASFWLKGQFTQNRPIASLCLPKLL